jgi:hypothetical protein
MFEMWFEGGKTVEHAHINELNESDPSGPLRNKQKYENDCLNGKNGVMGKTCLSELRFFSPFYITNIVFMHSVFKVKLQGFSSIGLTCRVHNILKCSP